MPLRYNIDHSPASIENGPAVMPGDTYDFTDEQVAVGIAGLWSENNPRSGARQVSAIKQTRDQQTADQAGDQQTADPAEKE